MLAATPAAFTDSNSDGAERMFWAACVLWSCTFGCNLFVVIVITIFPFNYYLIRNRIASFSANTQQPKYDLAEACFPLLHGFIKRTEAHRIRAAHAFYVAVPLILISLLLTIGCKQFASSASPAGFVMIALLASSILFILYTLRSVRASRQATLSLIQKEVTSYS